MLTNKAEKARADELRKFMTLKNNRRLITNEAIDILLEKGFFSMPASNKHHGIYSGGLFNHSLAVAKHLVEMTEQCHLEWCWEGSPYIVGMFHDLCKIDQYRHPIEEETGLPNLNVWEYNPDTLLKGHGEKSVMLLSQFFTLTEEEIACIVYHMGAFTTQDKWKNYTNAVHKWPNVLWTHHAHMLARHVDGV